MTTPTDSHAVRFNLSLTGGSQRSANEAPPRSPPIMMNLAPPPARFKILFELLEGSDDDDELQAHDESQEYIQSDFVVLFEAHGSDRPERLSSWLPCLPPMARELYEFTMAAIPVDTKLQRAAYAIEAGLDVAAIDTVYGRSVLQWACMLAHPALVAMLLQNGAEIHVNHVDFQGHSVLGCVHAFRRIGGIAQVIDALLDAGASVDTLPHQGAELLYRKDLTVSLVERLLRFGAEVDGGGAYAATPLLAGCGSVDWGAASMLLDFHADIHRKGAFGSSVLHNPRLPVWLAEQFYRRGADVNATDMQGDTPLMRACAHGNIPLARWLIAKGARLDAISDDQRSVLDHAGSAGTTMTNWLQRNGYVAADLPSAS